MPTTGKLDHHRGGVLQEDSVELVHELHKLKSGAMDLADPLRCKTLLKK
jgi:hypothetical protein